MHRIDWHPPISATKIQLTNVNRTMPLCESLFLFCARPPNRGNGCALGSAKKEPFAIPEGAKTGTGANRGRDSSPSVSRPLELQPRSNKWKVRRIHDQGTRALSSISGRTAAVSARQPEYRARCQRPGFLERRADLYYLHRNRRRSSKNRTGPECRGGASEIEIPSLSQPGGSDRREISF